MEVNIKDYERFEKQIMVKKVGLVGQKKLRMPKY